MLMHLACPNLMPAALLIREHGRNLSLSRLSRGCRYRSGGKRVRIPDPPHSYIAKISSMVGNSTAEVEGGAAVAHRRLATGDRPAFGDDQRLRNKAYRG